MGRGAVLGGGEAEGCGLAGILGLAEKAQAGRLEVKAAETRGFNPPQKLLPLGPGRAAAAPSPPPSSAAGRSCAFDTKRRRSRG